MQNCIDWSGNIYIVADTYIYVVEGLTAEWLRKCSISAMHLNVFMGVLLLMGNKKPAGLAGMGGEPGWLSQG